MLVLSRRTDETIRIGTDIVIRVLRIKGKTVRLGIEAPRSVRVVRAELPEEPEESEESLREPMLAASACVDWEGASW